MSWLILGMVAGVGGCASVEYRVPTWEVQRLAELPPAVRGGEVRVIPADDVVPAPAPPAVAEAEPPSVDVDVDVPIVVAPRPVVVAPRPVVIAPHPAVRVRPVGAVPGVWRPASPARPGISRPAPVGGHGVGTFHARSGRGGGHSGGGGAGAAAGAVAAVALVAIIVEAAAVAAAADAARVYDGWVAVDPGHPVRLYYKGNLSRVVPLAQLAGSDLVGLQYAVLDEDDGHVEPVRRAPPPVTAPPPDRMPAAPPLVATQPAARSPQLTGEIIAVRPAPADGQISAAVTPVLPSPAPPPAPVRQAVDSDSP